MFLFREFIRFNSVYPSAIANNLVYYLKVILHRDSTDFKRENDQKHQKSHKQKQYRVFHRQLAAPAPAPPSPPPPPAPSPAYTPFWLFGHVIE